MAYDAVAAARSAVTVGSTMNSGSLTKITMTARDSGKNVNWAP